jgi:ABC-type multidrug transport system fused ATPase/permease subunit
MSLVELRGASFGYNHQDIFKDINFKIGKGESFVLSGPTAAAKLLSWTRSWGY